MTYFWNRTISNKFPEGLWTAHATPYTLNVVALAPGRWMWSAEAESMTIYEGIATSFDEAKAAAVAIVTRQHVAAA